MSRDLLDIVASKSAIPVFWVTPPVGEDYLNLGDALSPVIVSMMSGLPVTHAPSKSKQARLAAVGTIGHMMAGGHVHFWGTGTSPNLNPGQHADEKIPYTRPADTQFTFHATRGPFSRRVLGGDGPDVGGGPAVYGDPLWLLPRFHDAPARKTHELGVILHLAELSERTFDARPRDTEGRHHISPSEAGSVKLINTVTPTSVGALRERLDDILSCKRIVSTSLHGMVFAESYGIPCLYFSPRSRSTGMGRIDLSDESGVIDLRFVDLYRGLGLSELDVWYQPRQVRTNWQDVIDAIDRVWAPKVFDDRPLIDSFPLPLAMIGKGAGGSAFDAPLIAALPTQRKRLPGQAFVQGLADRFLR